MTQCQVSLVCLHTNDTVIKSLLTTSGPISVINDLEAAKIKDIMENAVDLEVPNKVEYESGPNWGEIK